MKLRFASVFIAIVMILGNIPALADNTVYQVRDNSELAWYIVQELAKGNTKVYYSSAQVFDGQDLMDQISALTWLSLDSIAYSSKYVECFFYETEEMQELCISEAQRIVTQYITSDMTRDQKYLMLHNWVVNNTKYDLNAEYGGQTAWTVFATGRSVCAGYAKAFKLLCDVAGLPNMFVSGDGFADGSWGPHAWNAVTVDGEWKYVDTTFDDPESNTDLLLHDYFLLSRQEMDRDHAQNQEIGKLAVLAFPERDDIADILYNYGLFAGMGNGYGLNEIPNRNQVAALFMTLLGNNLAFDENPAAYAHPFTDVPEWANKHVAVMYSLGFTAGKSPASFGGADTLKLIEYARYILTALGYTIGVDFEYADSLSMLINMNIISQQEVDAINLRGIKRGDLVLIANRVLNTTMYSQNYTLFEWLYTTGKINQAQIN